MEDIQIIEKAIRENKYLEFIYHDTRRVVAPYRLEELKNGSMVLSGVREGSTVLRAFKLEEISGLDLLNRSFDAAIFHGFRAAHKSGGGKGTNLFDAIANPIRNLLNKIKR